jgi:hypothetical protein
VCESNVPSEYRKIAAKSDTKSGYISQPGPYCVFTVVNRKAAMNIYHANIAIPESVPEIAGNATRPYPGIRLGLRVERFNGIRSSGQYCSHKELTRTGTQMTARRQTHGRTAADGMCP